MTWAAATVFVGGAAVLLAADPFWAKWPTSAFVPFMALLIVTAILAATFIHQQFRRRRIAAHYIHACTNVATRWVGSEPAAGELDVVLLRHFTTAGQQTLAAVSQEFEKLMAEAESTWWDRDLAYALGLLWGLAAVLRILATWTGA